MDFIKCEIRDKIDTLKPYELLNLARYLKIETNELWVNYFWILLGKFRM